MSTAALALPGLLLATLTAVAACGRNAPPQAPAAQAKPAAPAAAARPAPRAKPAPRGTRTHACPGIDQLDTSGALPCTEIGCNDGFSIALFPTSAWPHGEYRFEIRHDSGTTKCRGRLPLPPCEQSGITCDNRAAGIGASGCALPPDQHAFSNIGFEGYPSVVDIDVLRDDVLLTQTHFEPAYRSSQPNGRGCEPACCSAHAALTLPKR